MVKTAIAGGSGREATLEWGSSGLECLPWWAGKGVVRKYLKKVNEDGKVFEYALFQPSLFLEHLAYAYKTAKYVDPLTMTASGLRQCQPFTIETVNQEDLEARDHKTSRVLGKKHSSVSEEQAALFATSVFIGTLLSSANGAWDVSDEVNRMFPDYKFAEIENFLNALWEGKV